MDLVAQMDPGIAAVSSVPWYEHGNTEKRSTRFYNDVNYSYELCHTLSLFQLNVLSCITACY